MAGKLERKVPNYCRWTEYQMNYLRRHYAKCDSVKDLAKTLKVPIRSIYRKVKELNLDHRNHVSKPGFLKRVRELYKAGLTDRMIAKELNVSYGTARRSRVKLGLKAQFRPGGRRVVV